MNELHGEKIDIVDWSEDPAELVGARAVAGPGQQRRGRRRRGPVGPGGRARLPAVAGDRQGGPERPPRRPADRLAHRHPLRRGPGRAGDRRPSYPWRRRWTTAGTDAGSALGPPAARLVRRFATASRKPVHDACPPTRSQDRVRTCIGCRQRAAKSELLRVVAGDRGLACEVVPDPAGRAPGRGAHLHPTTECLELARPPPSVPPGPPGPGRLATTAARGATSRSSTERSTDRDRPTDRNWSSSS